MTLSTDFFLSLFTLTLMEIVLGIDNIVFVAVLVDKLPAELQKKARLIGLSLALAMRILLLLSIRWLMSLTKPLFDIFSHEFTGKDIILLFGGLFLIWKSTTEIYEKMDDGHGEDAIKNARIKSFTNTIVQIILIDLVFSLDSVITAVGMANHIVPMILAVVVSMIVMIAASSTIADFIKKNPSIKVLALAFLILIGTMLLVEAMGQHIPKGYIYFAMFFSLAVEMVNMKVRKNHLP